MSGVQPLSLTTSSSAPRPARYSMISSAPPRYTAPCTAVSPCALTSLTPPPPTSYARRHRGAWRRVSRSEEHTSELQSREKLVCRLLLEKKKETQNLGRTAAA